MNYEQRYKEALEAVKELQEDNPSDDGIQNWINDKFPELRESEDERIRKEILEYFQQFENEELRGINISDWIAWLEKQGQKSAWTENDDEELEIAINVLKDAGQYDSAAWLITLKQRIRG